MSASLPGWIWVGYGQPVAGGQHLRFDPIEPAAFAGTTPVKKLAREQLIATNARVVAHGYRKVIEHEASLGILVFDQLAESGKQLVEYLFKLVQLARKATLVQRALAPVLLHVAPGLGQVSAKVACRHQDGGQHLSVAPALARIRCRRPGRAGSSQQLADKAVDHYNLFRHVQRQV